MYSLHIFEVKLTVVEMIYSEGTQFPGECYMLFSRKLKGAPKGEEGPVWKSLWCHKALLTGSRGLVYNGHVLTNSQEQMDAELGCSTALNTILTAGHDKKRKISRKIKPQVELNKHYRSIWEIQFLQVDSVQLFSSISVGVWSRFLI